MLVKDELTCFLLYILVLEISFKTYGLHLSDVRIYNPGSTPPF